MDGHFFSFFWCREEQATRAQKWLHVFGVVVTCIWWLAVVAKVQPIRIEICGRTVMLHAYNDFVIREFGVCLLLLIDVVCCCL